MTVNIIYPTRGILLWLFEPAGVELLYNSTLLLNGYTPQIQNNVMSCDKEQTTNQDMIVQSIRHENKEAYERW